MGKIRKVIHKKNFVLLASIFFFFFMQGFMLLFYNWMFEWQQIFWKQIQLSLVIEDNIKGKKIRNFKKSLIKNLEYFL